MTKVAVFYSGNARTFASCFPNQYFYVLRHFKDVKVYASIASDAEANSVNALQERFKNTCIEFVDQPAFPKADEMAAKHQHAGYPCTAKGQNILRAFWHYKKAFEMCNQPDNFDLFVRIRPDIWFQEFDMPPVGCIRDWDCWTPPWGSYGGINDRFAIMGRIAAERYFKAFDMLDIMIAEGAPLHPETLTRYAVERDGQAHCIQRLVTEFKIRRMKSVRHPQFNPNGDREWNVPEPVLGIEIMRAALA